MAAADRANLPDILHGNRLAPSGIVGYREHDQRNSLPAHFIYQSFQRRDVHIALEGMDEAGLLAFWNDQIYGFSSNKFDIRARGIKVRIVRYDIAFFVHHAEQDALRSAPLVSGDYMPIPEDGLNCPLETFETLAAGVTFVAFHNRCPLMGGHRSRAGVGEQIYQHICGWQKKKVVMRCSQQTFALWTRSPANGFNALNPKGLNDCSNHAVRTNLRTYRSCKESSLSDGL